MAISLKGLFAVDSADDGILWSLAFMGFRGVNSKSPRCRKPFNLVRRKNGFYTEGFDKENPAVNYSNDATISHQPCKMIF